MTDTRLTDIKNNNPLFNPKFIQKTIVANSILKNGEIPVNHKKIIEKRLSNHVLNKKTNERTLNNDFLVFFKEMLGYKSAGDQSNAKL